MLIHNSDCDSRFDDELANISISDRGGEGSHPAAGGGATQLGVGDPCLLCRGFTSYFSAIDINI